MKYKLLGRSGLRVSELALGTGRLSGKDGDWSEARRVLEDFAAAGGNFIDTSSAYQFGASEELIGSFLADNNRDGFVISSKFGRTAAREPLPASIGNHRKAMRAEVEASLRRLKTDRIDLYFAHFDDGVTPVEEIMRGFDELAREGKIIHAGLSNFPAWRIAAASYTAEMHGWIPVAVLQLQYNLLERAADREHLPLAISRGIGLMAWSPLAGGLLTGKTKFREKQGSPQSSEGMVTKDVQAETIIGTLTEIAAEQNCEPASAAMAWLGAKDILPVIGARTPAQLPGNLAATAIQLTAEQLERLEKVSTRPSGYPYELLAQQRETAGITDKNTGFIA